jgi:hypothetical protein
VPVAKEITIPIDWHLSQPATLADCMKAPNPLPVDPAAAASKTTTSGKVIVQILNPSCPRRERTNSRVSLQTIAL